MGLPNAAAERSVPVAQEWSPARIYLVASGIFLVVLGVAAGVYFGRPGAQPSASAVPPARQQVRQVTITRPEMRNNEFVLVPEKRQELMGLVGTMVQLGYLRMEEVAGIPHSNAPLRVRVWPPFVAMITSSRRSPIALAMSRSLWPTSLSSFE